MVAYEIQLETFSGPLDLLCHLIDKNQMNIYDIPIATVVEQYLDYLQAMQELDLEVTSEFLVMAAKLLAIKAKMLLPRPRLEGEEEDELVYEEDPREELVEKLLEYKQFKAVAQLLEIREKEQGQMYFRQNCRELYEYLFCPRNPLAGVTLEQLLAALKQVLERAEDQEDPKPVSYTREQFSIRDKMREILRHLVLYPEGITFSSLFTRRSSRAEVVTTFLAILELFRQGKIALFQRQLFGEIEIKGNNTIMIEEEQE